jgi:3D (Asp-Asp-Asp) domain-containing protein
MKRWLLILFVLIALALVWWPLQQWLGVRAGITRPPIGTAIAVQASAYSSSVSQTDSTPCITAAGTVVRPGVIATNFLPFGTIVTINNEQYIVEDRMNKRYRGRYIDIWFRHRTDALAFGRQNVTLTIVSYSTPGQTIRLQLSALTHQLRAALPRNVSDDVDCSTLR